MSKKVLFWDSWTRGIHNFIPIADKLRKNDDSCLLVHRGSWGSEEGRPTEEYIEGLLVRDISYYNTSFVYKVIKEEKPDCVLILTTSYFMDRAIILACRALGVKSFFLMHGIRAVGDNLSESVTVLEDDLRKKRWSRGWKYLRYTLPNYFVSGTFSDAFFPFRISPYKLILGTFLNPAKYLFMPPPSSEMYCDVGLIWANEYVSLFRDQFGYPEERLKVVGHPPLDDVFGKKNGPLNPTERETLLESIGLTVDCDYTLYLEDAFVESGFEGWTDESRRQHLSEIAIAVKKAGKSLVIKVHPGTKDDRLESIFDNDDHVAVVRKGELPLYIKNAESCIAHISSTVNLAICFEKMVLVPTWGISCSVPDYFVKSGVAVGCDNPGELEFNLCNLQDQQETLHKTRQDYIDRFITYTDGKAVDRIVGAIVGD